MSYVYVASPYTNSDPMVQETRYLRVMEYTKILLISGTHAFSPIVHCHEMAKVWEMPKEYKFWSSYNLAMLSGAYSLHVLQLPGYGQSIGVAAEIRYAAEMGLPIVYIPDQRYTSAII